MAARDPFITRSTAVARLVVTGAMLWGGLYVVLSGHYGPTEVAWAAATTRRDDGRLSFPCL